MGSDVVAFLDAGEWRDEVPKTAWLDLLSALAPSENAGNAAPPSVETGQRAEPFVSKFKTWMSQRKV